MDVYLTDTLTSGARKIGRNVFDRAARSRGYASIPIVSCTANLLLGNRNAQDCLERDAPAQEFGSAVPLDQQHGTTLGKNTLTLPRYPVILWFWKPMDINS